MDARDCEQLLRDKSLPPIIHRWGHGISLVLIASSIPTGRRPRIPRLRVAVIDDPDEES